MRRKVLFVIPTLDRCGAEKQMTMLATGLPRDRFDVRVAVLTRLGPYSQTLADADVPVTLIGKKLKASPCAYFKLKKLIREFQPDVVHTWLFAANSYGRKAAFACGSPVVVCGERCVDPWKGALHDFVDRRLAAKTDAYAVNSSGIVDFYTKRGLPAEKFAVIPNAVESREAIAREERAKLKRAILAELGLPRERGYESQKNKLFRQMAISDRSLDEGEPFLIGLVARLWPQKRVRDAVWIADQLKFALLNFYLVIIGDGPERDALLRYRDDLQIRDRVIFLGERTDVARFMPAFDLLWNCSEYEGQSNSILEALSFGVPVMATDIPGNRDMVIPGETGVLISDYDGDESRRRTAFSRETLRIFSPENEATRLQIQERARTFAQREFSYEKMIARHVDLYERLLKERKS